VKPKRITTGKSIDKLVVSLDREADKITSRKGQDLETRRFDQGQLTQLFSIRNRLVKISSEATNG